MRQIKFRGLRINNVTKESGWVYGAYFKGNENTYILQKKAPCEKDNQSLNPFKPLRVIHKTIGQFTGLTDKNGVEIFEGDLLRVCDNNNGYLKVEFINAYVGGWVLTHETSDDKISLGARRQDEIEVIGNIHQ